MKFQKRTKRGIPSTPEIDKEYYDAMKALRVWQDAVIVMQDLRRNECGYGEALFCLS